MECRPAGQFFPWRNNKRYRSRMFLEWDKMKERRKETFYRKEKKLKEIRSRRATEKLTRSVAKENISFILNPFLSKLIGTFCKTSASSFTNEIISNRKLSNRLMRIISLPLCNKEKKLSLCNEKKERYCHSPQRDDLNKQNPKKTEQRRRSTRLSDIGWFASPMESRFTC